MSPGTALDLRARIHMGTGLGALLLGVLPRPWALAGAGVGVLVGFVLIPLSGLERRLRREGEGFWNGLRTYPLAVLGLVALLPPAAAAAGWGVLAFGDVAASVVGRSVPAPRLLGHPKATWSGSVALVVVGAAAAWGLSHGAAALGTATGLVATGAAPGVLVCLAAAGAAALLDLVPIPPDDNGPIALAAGGTLWLLRG